MKPPQLLLTFLLAAGLSAPAAQAVPSPITTNKHRVLVISLDGMRPELYLSDQWKAPNLKRLLAGGAHVQKMIPVFPTVTYVNHTTLITGVRPIHHGIFGNEQFDWDKGPLKSWNWQASLITAPTIFSLAHQAGITTEAYSWPVSVGAPVDWLMPEIFQTAGVNATSEQLVRQSATPGLLDEAEKLTPGPFPDEFGHLDAFVTRGFVQTWTQHHPQLGFLHLINVDWLQHQTGPESPQTHKALEDLDRDIGMVADVVDPKTTTLFVLGDHGFQGVHTQVSLNHLFLDKQWIKLDSAGEVTSWTVIAQTHGGGAAIFCKDPALQSQVVELLKANQGEAYRVLDRARLDELGTFPKAICGVTALPGFSLQAKPAKPFMEAISPPRGQHGHLPEYVPTGLIAWGKGVRKGKDLGVIPNLDVAPTICQLVGLPTKGMEGHPIDLR